MEEAHEIDVHPQPANSALESLDPSRREDEHLEPELAKLLVRPSRWERREGPFQGFGSPQGKF